MSSFVVGDLTSPALFLGLAYKGDRNVMVSGKAIRFPCDATQSLCVCRRNRRQKWEVVGFRKPAASSCNPAESRHIGAAAEYPMLAASSQEIHSASLMNTTKVFPIHSLLNRALWIRKICSLRQKYFKFTFKISIIPNARCKIENSPAFQSK
jgi:hypothetical protein